MERAAGGRGPIVLLTGAGISAESGIPTFRGAEGYWTIGSRHYRPMELATWSAFTEVPDDVWGWYLYRRSVCRAAAPNAAHAAVAGLERSIGDRFLLVTQNVDGLHLRAGNTLARTFQIHGSIDFMRCAAECVSDPEPLPETLGTEWEKGRPPGPREKDLLRCSRCGGPARPHVLWFDETYDEPRFRFQSSLQAAIRAELLVVIGTSGATNLPNQMCEIVASRGAPMVVVDPEPTPFSELALGSRAGVFREGTACAVMPALCDEIRRAVAGAGKA
ncbi:MAG: RNA polymerase subunit sigma [Deltaproteobacteria bacterium]|nr:RNA polymerase subunit sigma [Deltaproteobacteria bacterium]